jgi:hypothetical protein
MFEYEQYLRGEPLQYTCHYDGTDEFMDAFFERLKTEPYSGGHPCNWLWNRLYQAARAARRERFMPATESSLAEALANRDAILALPLDVSDDCPNWVKIDSQLRRWFGDSKLIDYRWIAERLAA